MSKNIAPPDKSRPDANPIPVVAIGASAGGLEAVSQIFENLSPNTGMAYVYIQHLSPTYESRLSEILSRVTQMPVFEAEHLMELKANSVYIIPPDKDMEVEGNRLELINRQPRPIMHMPIDKFLISLAKREKEGAIGIILSGMAHDGTLGLKAIKVAGGITIAQNETAKHLSMPRSAIQEGVVDMVLSPMDIAKELERLGSKSAVLNLAAVNADEEDAGKVDEDLKQILLFLKRAVGVDFDHYKMSTIRRRISRRMLLYKLDTLRDYVVYLQQYPSEAENLYNDLLINVTNFFRDSEVMEYLKKKLFPQIIKTKSPEDTIRIWIPACSTGQEAYSLAMILVELLGENSSTTIQIFASDLSEFAIAKARQGLYTKSEVSDVTPVRLQRFFLKRDDKYAIKKSIRDLCVFAPHNVLRDPPFSRLDMISCRNLLIYLDTVFQQKIMATFHYALNPEGLLLLGNSEAVGSSVSLFSQLDKKQKVFMRKSRETGKATFDMNIRWNVETRLGNVKSSPVQRQSNQLPAPARDLDKEVDSLLLKKYVPACIVVDQDLEILQFRGSTGLFLEHAPGKASFNLLKMARPSLVFELRNAIHKSRKSGETAKKSGLEMKVNDRLHYVKIEVVPLRSFEDQFLFLVLFEEIAHSISADENTPNFRDDRIKQLEMELSSLRKDMHSIIEEQETSNEELQSANEEIVSSNEELQSINEELETSKEEIESTNEELLTINQELQIRNDQLTEAYGYSEAIFSTIGEATLLLDRQLQVKSANKAFYKIFHVQQEDIEGKMFYELHKGQWDIAQLRQLLEEVITNNVHIKAYEVCLNFAGIGEKTMLLHARKVVQHERKEVILLVIEDVTEQRRVQHMLEERQAWFHDMIDHAPALIWVTGPEGRINFLNKAFLEFSGLENQDNPDLSFADLIHPEDRSHYDRTFARNFEGQNIFSIEYRLQRRDGEYRWVLETAKPMFSPEKKFTGYIGNGTDIHLQKTLSQQLNSHVKERTQQLKETNEELEISNRELRKTADRLQSVLNGVPAAITLMEALKPDGAETVSDFITSVYNEKALEFNGQSSDDIIGRSWMESHPDLKDTELFDLYLHVLETGEPVYKEISDLTSGGDKHYAFFITRQIDENGVVVTILDISERKTAEVKLIRMMENLQAVLDCSPGSISYLKPIYDQAGDVKDFRLEVYNQNFAKEYNKPLSALADKRATELFSEEDVKKMKRVLSTGERSYEEIYQEQDDKWIGISVVRHKSGVVIAGLNITSLKEAERQQSKWVQQLEESNEMIQSLEQMRQYISHRGEFLRATSHDLRGTFGIIMGATALLNLMDTEEDRNKSLDMLQRNLRQVTSMLNQLLDYSRLEAGKEKIEVTSFDLSELLSGLCESMIQISRDKGLELNVSEHTALIVRNDAVKIRRIAQNLILNALKYTDDGSVSVRWGSVNTVMNEIKSDKWFIEIEDTGNGLSQNLVTKLTHQNWDKDQLTPFQNVGSSTGEGIGLFIVKRLCELLAGELTIESKTGEGTLFRIVFPLEYQESSNNKI
ncbi:two-component system, chemotaxis family, CheB/CheR fusion protein [Dyadobacter koreensis]|uniref:Two-component system, chemotaxis family, CheB/CheR fusion protein n=1 Tax=Dyadobacter koreensis TaxID=408657 RepID=A0A1H6UM03_9BACT|nr:CheR family methyltransferase [Dyadobacter koreensis]SEI93329.1 two-component system, chemotaxis family, CheB/CheR fusion protein [Dyadobacter koreensis]